MKKIAAILICPAAMIALAFWIAGVTWAEVRDMGDLDSGTVASKQVEIPTACDLAWRIVESPNFGQYNSLFAVTAIASDDAWAVGNTSNPNAPLLEHWDGMRWAIPSPTPIISLSHRLFGVDAAASDDVWAVGSYSDGGGTDQTLTMHWDGTAWSWILSPNGTGYFNELASVAVIAPNDIWAVGSQRFSGYISHSLTMHWNGTVWSIVPSPDVNGSSYLRGVTAIASSDVWAVGASTPTGTAQPFMLHWDGVVWNVVPGPTLPWGGHLQAAASIGSGDVWAVGDYTETSTAYYNRTLTMHWDGSAWSIVPSPNIGSDANHLWGVSALASNEVWAVGSYFAGSVTHGIAIHWDGASWMVVTTPNPNPNPSPSATPPISELLGVGMTAPHDVWAVGDFENVAEFRTLTEHYSTTGCETATPTPTGTITSTPTHTPTPTATSSCPLAWTTVPSLSYNGANRLKNVEAVSSNDIWAIGDVTTGSSDGILEHWNGTTWSFVPYSYPGYAERLDDISAVSSNDAWLVGWFRGSFSGTLTEHWDGTHWTYMQSPNGGGGTQAELTAVSARASDDIWAVGSNNGFGGSNMQPLILHGNGTGWAVAGVPDIGGYGYLTGVVALAADDAWAVGRFAAGSLPRPFVLHWDGTIWSVAAIPTFNGDSGLYGVVGLSADDVWAVGYNVGQTLTMHWDGTAWSIVPSPNVGSAENYLYGTDMLGSEDVWAVGKSVMSGIGQTLTMHWDGTVWSIVPSPSPNLGGAYNGVSMIAPNQVWAAGHTTTTTSTLTLTARYAPASSCGNTSTPTPTAAQTTPTVTLTAAVITGTATEQVASATVAASATPPPTATSTPTSTATSASASTPTLTATPTYGASATAMATPTVCTMEFSDVPQGSTFFDYIQCLACEGIVNGYPDGTFRPDADVTRGQLAKIVSNAAGFSDPVTAQMFEDVPVGSTFYDFVGRLASRELLGGYPCGGIGEPCVEPDHLPYFRPNSDATRGQIGKIVANSAGYDDPPGEQIFEDVAPGSTFFDYIQRLANRGEVNGYPCGGMGEPCVEPGNLSYFRPGDRATRGQTSKIVAITFFADCPVR